MFVYICCLILLAGPAYGQINPYRSLTRQTGIAPTFSSTSLLIDTASPLVDITNVQDSTFTFGDFNNDNNIDVVVCVNSFSAAITLYLADPTTNLFPTEGSQGVDSAIATSCSPMATADLNNDGFLDLIVGQNRYAVPAQNSIAWYPNDGTGFLGSAVSITGTSNWVSAIVARDFDLDGHVDAAASVFTAAGWVRNTGSDVDTSVFSSATICTLNYESTFELDQLASDDIDGDGWPDLYSMLVSNSSLSTQFLYFINSAQPPVVGSNACNANQFGQGVVYQVAQSNPTTGISALTSIDLDFDGLSDMVMLWYDGSSKQSQMVTIKNNGYVNGVLTFSSPEFHGLSFSGGTVPTLSLYISSVLTAADLNGDGYPEVLACAPGIAGAQNLALYIFTNLGPSSNSSVSFQQTFVQSSVQSYQSSVAPVAVVHVTEWQGLGIRDVIVLHSSSGLLRFANDQQPIFGEPNLIGPVSFNETILDYLFADMNGDGFEDLVELILNLTSVHVRWFINNGNRVFSQTPSKVSSSMPGYSSGALASVDIDVDGHMDIGVLTASPTLSVGYIVRNCDGLGTFCAPKQGFSTGSAISDISFVFRNGSNAPPDLIYCTSISSASPPLCELVYNDGTGVFNQGMILQVPGVYIVSYFVLVDDFNRDGFQDFCVSGITLSAASLVDAVPFRLFMWQNLQNGNFSSPIEIAPNSLQKKALTVELVQAAFSADVDNDGYTDILFSLVSGLFFLIYNSVNGFVDQLIRLPTTCETGTVSLFLACIDLNTDGRCDFTYGCSNGVNTGGVYVIPSVVVTPQSPTPFSSSISIQLFPIFGAYGPYLSPKFFSITTLGVLEAFVAVPGNGVYMAINQAISVQLVPYNTVLSTQSAPSTSIHSIYNLAYPKALSDWSDMFDRLCSMTLGSSLQISFEGNAPPTLPSELNVLSSPGLRACNIIWSSNVQSNSTSTLSSSFSSSPIAPPSSLGNPSSLLLWECTQAPSMTPCLQITQLLPYQSATFHRVLFTYASSSNKHASPAPLVSVQGATLLAYNSYFVGGSPAIILAPSSLLLVSSCLFANNSYTSAGAIYSSDSFVFTINSAFTDNTGSTGPGAVYGLTSTLMMMFVSSSGNNGVNGGFLGTDESTVILLNNSVTDNDATNGGAVYFNSVLLGELTVLTSSFTSNTANHNGGAFYFRSALTAPIIDNSVLLDNQATQGLGNAIYWFTDLSYPILTDCVVGWTADIPLNTKNLWGSRSFSLLITSIPSEIQTRVAFAVTLQLYDYYNQSSGAEDDATLPCSSAIDTSSDNLGGSGSGVGGAGAGGAGVGVSATVQGTTLSSPPSDGQCDFTQLVISAVPGSIVYNLTFSVQLYTNFPEFIAQTNIPVEPCAAGEILNGPNCQPCQSGTYTVDGITCLTCLGGYQSVNNTPCTACDIGSSSHGGSSPCQPCSAGTFSASIGASVCSSCRAQFVCESLIGIPISAPDYWIIIGPNITNLPNNTNNVLVAECLSDWCDGGTPADNIVNACKDGHLPESYMCGTCNTSAGYYMYDGDCRDCSTSQGGGIVFLYLVLMLWCIWAYFLMPGPLESGTFAALTFFFQSIGLLASSFTSVSSASTSISWVNAINMELVFDSCPSNLLRISTLGSSFYVEFWLKLAQPFILIAMVLFLVLIDLVIIQRFRDKSRAYLNSWTNFLIDPAPIKDRFIKSLVAICVFSYTPVVKTMLQSTRCMSVFPASLNNGYDPGISVLVADPSVDCDTSSVFHAHLIVSSILLVIVGPLPILIFALSWRQVYIYRKSVVAQPEQSSASKSSFVPDNHSSNDPMDEYLSRKRQQLDEQLAWPNEITTNEDVRVKQLMQRIGIVLAPFRLRKAWFWLVIEMRKIIVLFIVVYVDPTDLATQGTLLSALFLTLLIIEVRVKPFYSSLTARADIYSLAILSIVCQPVSPLVNGQSYLWAGLAVFVCLFVADFTWTSLFPPRTDRKEVGLAQIQTFYTPGNVELNRRPSARADLRLVAMRQSLQSQKTDPKFEFN